MRVILLVMAMSLGGIAGCSKAPEATPARQQPGAVTAPATNSESSTMKTVVDGFTGRAVVERGIETRDKAKAAREKEKADLDEVMP